MSTDELPVNHVLQSRQPKVFFGPGRARHKQKLKTEACIKVLTREKKIKVLTREKKYFFSLSLLPIGTRVKHSQKTVIPNSE